MKTIILVVLLALGFKLISATFDYFTLKKTIFIYPGTKWCGLDNNTVNDEDLGTAVETDKCCKVHDLCQDYILPGETNYNLTNSALHKRLSCRCDEDFHECLKSVNTVSSRAVGNIFFNLLRNKCFREDYPVIGCNTYNALLGRCLEYRYDTNKDKKYQWFYVKAF